MSEDVPFDPPRIVDPVIEGTVVFPDDFAARFQRLEIKIELLLQVAFRTTSNRVWDAVVEAAKDGPS